MALALGVVLTLSPRSASAQHAPSPSRHLVVLPVGELFAPLIADLTQPQFQIAVLLTGSPVLDDQLGAVGFGETFGLLRKPGGRPGDGWQVSLAGAVFAQFELRRQSTDLVNSDFVVGLPITYRRGRTSARLMLHHQSSHLGDEYLLRENPARLNVSWDAVQLLVSRDLGVWRIYGGIEHVFVHAPEPLKDGVLEGGVEYRRPAPLFRTGARQAARWIAALDLQSWQRGSWQISASARAGIELGPLGPADEGLGRTWSLVIEAFHGPTPFGQFYGEQISYVGLGLHFR